MIPKLSLTHISGMPDGAKDFLPLVRHQLTPPGIRLNPFVYALARGIAHEYALALGDAFKEKVQARLTFSAADGVRFDRCTDQRMVECFEKHRQKISLSPDQATVLGMHGVLENDAIGCGLKLYGLEEPFQLDLEVSSWERREDRLTTSLHHLHLLRDLFKRYGGRLDSPDFNICLVEPRMSGTECPQLAEIHSLFSKGRFLVLGKNDILQKQLERGRYIVYDPLMLHLRTFPGKVRVNTPKSYMPVFNRMRDVFKEQAPAQARIVDGFGEIKPLILRVDAERIQIRDFNVVSSPFQPEDQGAFDVVVAGLALTHAAEEAAPLELLKRYIPLLKEGGTLYVDELFFHIMKMDYFNKKAVEEALGPAIEMQLIDLGDLLETDAAPYGPIPAFSLGNYNQFLKDLRMPQIMTQALVAITRRSNR